ncbi:MAG: hypothetical protein ACREPX_12315 [Rhodanobacteraceae bacterium]
MDDQQKNSTIRLIKAVGLMQLKVLLSAARDLAIGPLALVAAFFDLVLLKVQEPRFFRSVLRLGEHSDAWIDPWYVGGDPDSPHRENVDALLDRVEEVVRDPQTGARKARVLKRWAERQLAARSASNTSKRTVMPPDDPT